MIRPGQMLCFNYVSSSISLPTNKRQKQSSLLLPSVTHGWTEIDCRMSLSQGGILLSLYPRVPFVAPPDSFVYSVARLLQRCCKDSAEPLLHFCRTTASPLQSHCKRGPESLQRHCKDSSSVCSGQSSSTSRSYFLCTRACQNRLIDFF